MWTPGNDWAPHGAHEELAGFAPTDIDGAVLWLRADRGITLDTGVSAWANQVENARHLVQAATVSQPAIGDIAGKAAIAFDGVNDNLAGTTASDWTLLHNGSGATLAFSISNDDVDTNGQAINTERGNATDKGFRLFWSSAGGGNGSYQLTMGNGSGTHLVNVSAVSVTGAQFFIIRFGPTSVATRRNGAAIAGLSAAYNGSPSPDAPQAPLMIGNSVAGGGNPWLGRFRDVVMWDRVLTDDECTEELEPYLAAGVGLAA
jgi:hypothetical protein